MGIRLTESVIDLIEGRNLGHLATLMNDDSLQVTPVWIDHEGDLILVNTALGKVKQRNGARDPRVAIGYPYRQPSEKEVILKIKDHGDSSGMINQSG